MLITWDESKRRANLKKHGVDFSWLNEFFGNCCITREDLRFRYEERRFTGTGPFEGRILVAAFTYRKGGFMSSHAGKPRDVKHAITTIPSLGDEDVRARFEEMDDGDIIFDDDTPELTPDWFDHATMGVDGRAPTVTEVEDLKAVLLAYINRPVKPAK